MFIETRQSTTSLSQDAKTSFGKRGNLPSDVIPSRQAGRRDAVGVMSANVLSQSPPGTASTTN